MAHYAIKLVRLESGERLPILCDRQSGLPIHKVTLWVLTELRAVNLSVSTIQQALQSIMVLLSVLDELKIDLVKRLYGGAFLTVSEIELVARCCKFPAAEIKSLGAMPSGKVNAVEKVSPQVSVSTVSIRLYYIKRYLGWIATTHLMGIGASSPNFLPLEKLKVLVLESVQARIPSGRHYLGSGSKTGLSESDLKLMQRYVAPDFEANPWGGAHVRQRNYLIFRWLLSLGVRRGELLGIKISDINFQSNEVFIARRSDDPADPRRRQPCAKTSPRLLALDPELAELTRNYIMSDRRMTRGAKRHEFLWVATGTGRPMSLACLNKIFKTLRLNCELLPDDLSPHTLRHTWNELFSDAVDKHGVSPELEQKIRSRMMGWSETSGMAKVYNQRHIRKKATEVSLEMQGRISMAGGSDEKKSKQDAVDQS